MSVLYTRYKKTFYSLVSIIFIVIVSTVYYGDVLNKKTSIQSIKTLESFQNTVQIGTTTLNVLIADTSKLREKGLSGRKELLPEEGMFFIFDRSDFYSFWMKEMNFPIDIIWIGDDFRVVDITHSVPVDSFPKSFSPITPARYVLEVNAGFSQNHNVQNGDFIDFPAYPVKGATIQCKNSKFCYREE